MQSQAESNTPEDSDLAEISTLVERLSARLGQAIAVEDIRDVVTEEYDQLLGRARIQRVQYRCSPSTRPMRLRPVAPQDRHAA